MVILGFAGWGWVLGGLGGLDLWVWFGGIWVWWWDCGFVVWITAIRGKKGALCGCFGGNLGRFGLWREIRPGELSNCGKFVHFSK